VPYILSGQPTKVGLTFCCHIPWDTFWHLGVSDSVSRQFPPEAPGLGGIPLNNYHFFNNIISGELVRIFHFPLIPLQMQFLPIYLSSLYGLLIISFCRHLSFPRIIAVTTTFLAYFATDGTYLLARIFSGIWHLDYNPIYISQKALFNQSAFSATVLVLATFMVMLKFQSRYFFHVSLVIAVLVSAAVGFKTHFGILLLGGILFTSIIYFLKERRLNLLLPAVFSLLLSLLVYLPFNHGTGGVYPSWFWRVETAFQDPIFAINQTELATISWWTKNLRLFSADSNTIINVLWYETRLVALHTFALFGALLLGGLTFFIKKRSNDWFISVSLSSGLAGYILGMFFQQKTGVGHTYNFLIYTYIILLLLSGVYLSYLWKQHRQLTMFTIILIVIMQLPIAIATSAHIGKEITRGLYFIISQSELAAFRFLKENTKPTDMILIDPSNQPDSIVAYSSAFIQRPLYLSGEYTLSGANLPIQKRKFIIKQYYKNIMTENDVNQLAAEGIKYIIRYQPLPLMQTGTELIIPIVYANNQLVIQKILH
jgi:hypothetical protein